tara:strand:+ start:1996 stop:2202 length:207 start_codon:yes stop_codon:yes gene_type:complete
MKHLQILCILLLLPFLAFSQGYRKLTRQGNKAYKEQDYATATINATKALQKILNSKSLLNCLKNLSSK